MRPITAVLALALGACAHEKVRERAAGVPPDPDRQGVAEVAAAGVTVKVTGDSWGADSQDLEGLFTPLRVSINNRSGKTLRVSYRDISLSGASGFQYPAIPPIKARGTISVSAAPSSTSPPLAVWEHDLDDDGFHANPPERLCTEALPEGAVQDGESVAGLVYFPGVTEQESAVEFEMTLVDSSDHQAFGRVAIPFQTTER